MSCQIMKFHETKKEILIFDEGDSGEDPCNTGDMDHTDTGGRGQLLSSTKGVIRHGRWLLGWKGGANLIVRV